ncbi:MAG: DUF4163 domain-containing protein [Sphingorhabdus sp.]
MKPITKTLIAPLLLAAIPAMAAPKDVSLETKGEGYSFSFSYPQIVTQFPKLKTKVENERQSALQEAVEDGKSWMKDRPENFGGITLDRQISWQQVTNLPNYLSLSIDDYRYDGGAHGNFWRSSFIWDKAAAKRIKPLDMFSSKAAFDRLVQTPYCDLLDVERSHKRNGEKVDRSKSDDWMQACPKPSDLVVILGSSNGKQFNRVAIYAAPYAVGPYSEGDYEIDMGITPQLLAAVKPAYRASFALTPVTAGRRR